MSGIIMAVCISEKKGTKKHPVPSAMMIEDHGILGDAHAVDRSLGERDPFRHRQISLLANESVDKMRALGAELHAGDFGENILTEGIELVTLPIGTRLRVGQAELEVTQIGKQCHSDCEIKKQVGKCVMPTEGIFAKVVRGGEVREGDSIMIL